MSTPPLADRIALVTGASRGIGRATALALARAGAHVVAVARTVGGLEELDDAIRLVGGSATLVPLDLKDTPGIVRLAAALGERYQRLDVLIGNAGILGPLSPLGHVTADAWNEVLEINLTANWRLIRTLDPLLRRSEAGRAIFLSSGAATSPRAYWGPYAASKAGLEALVKVYADEVANTPVRVNLVNPGPTRTAMRAKAFPGEDPAALKPPDHVVETCIKLALPGCADNGKLFDLKTGTVR